MIQASELTGGMLTCLQFGLLVAFLIALFALVDRFGVLRD